MDLTNLYEVLVDNVEIQVWGHIYNGYGDGDKHGFGDDNEGVIFEGRLYDSYKAVEPYEYCRVVQIEVDNQGKLYVEIEIED